MEKDVLTFSSRFSNRRNIINDLSKRHRRLQSPLKKVNIYMAILAKVKPFLGWLCLWPGAQFSPLPVGKSGKFRLIGDQFIHFFQQRAVIKTGQGGQGLFEFRQAI
jgi:hypothetical protein